MKKLLTALFTLLFAGNMALAYDCAEVRAEHILVKTKAEAQQIENLLDKRGTNFEELAKQYSLCPSGKNGGDLGYFKPGQMVFEFEQAAFHMAIGEISEPVRTQFGWHIIKVLDKK